MHARISVLTLGVDDLDASVRFYRDGLGLATKGVVGQEFEHGAVAFFDLQSGLKLALWPRSTIARDTGIAQTGCSTTEFTIGHNVGDESEVDAIFARAIVAGAVPVKTPQAAFWGGYSAYFQDLDGHLWEIVYNPSLLPDE